MTLSATLKNCLLSPKYSHSFYTGKIQAHRKLMRKNGSILTGSSEIIWVSNNSQ